MILYPNINICQLKNYKKQNGVSVKLQNNEARRGSFPEKGQAAMSRCLISKEETE